MRETQGAKFDFNLMITLCVAAFRSDSLSRIEELEYRTMIEFPYLKAKILTKVKAELDSMYENASPIFTTV